MGIQRAGCCCSACDTITPIDGCLTCSCARASSYKICITGETGDAAVLNSTGTTLTRVSDWLFRFTSAASHQVELEFDSGDGDDNDIEIRSYLWDGGAFVLERTLTGSMSSATLCQQTLSSGAVSYKVWPLGETTPDTVEVTTDYNIPGGYTCTDNRSYNHATKTWIIDANTGLDGTFELTRSAAVDRCTYTAVQGTISLVNAVDAGERIDDVPVVWTFNMIDKSITVRADFSGTAHPTMECNIWEVDFTDGPHCVPAGGTYGPQGNELCCVFPFNNTTGGTQDCTFDEISVEVPAI